MPEITSRVALLYFTLNMFGAENDIVMEIVEEMTNRRNTYAKSLFPHENVIFIQTSCAIINEKRKY